MKILRKEQREKMELSLKNKFDYIIVNENLENAVIETSALVKKILKGDKTEWQ